MCFGDSNKKVKQLGRRSALTCKLQDSQIIVVENFSLDAPKTKEMVNIAKNLKVEGKKALFVLPTENKNVTLSVRNIPNAQTIVASDVNTYVVMNSNAIILTEGALESINNI